MNLENFYIGLLNLVDRNIGILNNGKPIIDLLEETMIKEANELIR